MVSQIAARALTLTIIGVSLMSNILLVFKLDKVENGLAETKVEINHLRLLAKGIPEKVLEEQPASFSSIFKNGLGPQVSWPSIDVSSFANDLSSMFNPISNGNVAKEVPHEVVPEEVVEEAVEAEEPMPRYNYYGRGNGEKFSWLALGASFFSMDFALYVVTYYTYYFALVGVMTAIAVYVFKVDYVKNVDSKQLKREFLLTLESYTTNAIMYWITIQMMPAWSYDTDILSVAKSFVVNINVFNFFFYLSHKLWHSNRTLYYLVHEHHHRSVVVCPLTSLANAWPESVWTSFGFAFGPLILGTNNIWSYYLTIFTIVFVAVVGHSRIPFALEHATHHAVLTTNFGFYSSWTGMFTWDGLFGTWRYAEETSRVVNLYPTESAAYTWNKNEQRILWDKVGVSADNKIGLSAGDFADETSIGSTSNDDSMAEDLEEEIRLSLPSANKKSIGL